MTFRRPVFSRNAKLTTTRTGDAREMLFNPDNHTRTSKNKKIYAYCELAYSIVDFSAAALFILGSVLFFNETTVVAGTWLFLVGSVFFGLRPSIKLFRELAYLRIGDFDDLAANLK